MMNEHQRGMTLLELLVAIALLSVVAVLSAQLVIQSTKLIDSTARATRNPDLLIAGQWLRRDLYEAVSVIGVGEGWNDQPLVLVAQSGSWTAFAAVDGELVRTGAQPGTSPSDTRVLLRGLLGWRWRVDDNAAITVEFTSFANPEAYHNLTGRESFQLQRRTERMTFALRGVPGGRAW
jgi:prepilin-type N-terminal cleavage/methylation domain-containing protein